ncbi:MAG: phage portal protein [Ruminococcaceae bacterium]|nr:phage portal protein [Oscillospiraceae bacterium]
MIGEEILSVIAERFGEGAANVLYYKKIDEWEAWWKGYNRSFHEFTENGAGGRLIRRELYRMNMAKKIAEDWASLLLNDRTAISVSDEVGGEFVGKVLSTTDFMSNANRLVEKAFALGTGAAILRISGAYGEDGEIIPSEATFAFEFVDASHIIPLSVRDGKIVEAAFVSEGKIRGEEYVYLEIHCLEEDGYVISNEFYRRVDGRLVRSDVPLGNCPEVVHTMSRVPLFSILTPSIQNNIDPTVGLGVSVFADATDCLKGVDLAFNNFCRDIKLGGKKVFINQTLVNRDEYGNVFTPDDVAQQLFVTIGDSDLADHPMITEHNPELRTAENAEAVQCQLNYLSFRCGLGTHHYTFGDLGGRVRLTATQYMGERQDMRQNASKHQKNVASFLRGVVEALLWCGAEVCGLPIDKNAAVNVTFDDSYWNDSESQRARDLSELEAGIITVDEYRSKWIGGDING